MTTRFKSALLFSLHYNERDVYIDTHYVELSTSASGSAAGALGGPNAMCLLLQVADRISPAVDLAICVVVISLLTASSLGAMLLARFVRKARAGGGAALAATDLFAQVTAMVSVGTALLVTACLLVVPDGGLGAAVRLPIDCAVRNPTIVTVLAICAAAVPLWARFFRGVGSAGGPEPTTTIKVAVFLVAVSRLVASFVVPGGFDAHAQPLFPEFHWRRSMVTMPIGVAIAIVTVASTTLFIRCPRRARNTAGAGGAAARTS